MSSPILRDAFEAAWPTILPTIRLERTENRDLPRNPPLVLPDLWGTIYYGVEDRRHVTMGANPWVEETGTVTVVLMAKSGHGTGPVMTAAQAAVHALEGWQSPAGDAWLVRIGAPRALEPEADGEWMIYGIPCAYLVQERVALP